MFARLPQVCTGLLVLTTVALLGAVLPSVHAEVIRRGHLDGTVTYVVPAAPVAASTSWALRAPWPWFPHQDDLGVFREQIHQQEHQAYAASVTQLSTPPPSSLVRREQPDGRVALFVLQRVPSLGGTFTFAEGIQQAKQAYETSLDRVSQDPSCTECRREAVRLGRLAKGLSRPEGKVTIYDEAAIANDLNAAGGARVPMLVPTPEPGEPASPAGTP
jgi:hypothetical protein